MKSSFDFNRQIKIMNEIFQSNISLAETANIYIKKIRPEFINRAIKELKMDYEYLYLKQEGDKFNSIRSTLHLIARQKTTNIDELFMDLGEQINSYYGTKYLDLEKKIPYSKECPYCNQYVSNYQGGLQLHQQKCAQDHKIIKKTAPKLNQANSFDRKYKGGTKKLQILKRMKEKEDQEGTHQSKKISIRSKKDQKSQQNQRNKIAKVKTQPNFTEKSTICNATDILEQFPQILTKQDKSSTEETNDVPNLSKQKLSMKTQVDQDDYLANRQ